jgi:hypothetical protein
MHVSICEITGHVFSSTKRKEDKPSDGEVILSSNQSDPQFLGI